MFALAGATRAPSSHGPHLHMVDTTSIRAAPCNCSTVDRGALLSPGEMVLLSIFGDEICVNVIERWTDPSERTIRGWSCEFCDRIGGHATIDVVGWAARRQLI